MNAGNARVFISYSHRGNSPKWKAALIRGLHVFEQHHLLDVWQDGKIRVSSFWDDDIKQAMTNAQLAVVLLTKEALESEYIIETEFPFLCERQQRDKLPVFPVICEECDWREHDWLRATQAPNNSNPLSQLSEAAQERVFRKLSNDIAEELRRVALAELPTLDRPTPSDRIYLDKFPLAHSSGAREEKLIGREQELALLALAFAQPRTAIVSLVAWGGVGKTMLVQHWLQRLEREGWFGARRVYAWSFYSQGTKEDRQASEDTFLAHALEWFGVQCEPTLSPWDKGRLLADAVSRERTLLILDGIEPLQYPPGPMGGQLRAPGVQSLLKQLSRKANDTEHRGLCLVTTRETLADLADFQRRPDAAWGSVLRVDLGNLIEEAGAALLHHGGANRVGPAEIKADDAELLASSREVDGHALTLNLLGRFIARAHGGDIRRRDLVKFEEADRKEQGGTTFKMLAAFENWFGKGGEFGVRRLGVMRLLGLFDRPADAGCLAALRNAPVIAGLTDPFFTTRLDGNTGQSSLLPLVEEDWNEVISFLCGFGLLAVLTSADNRERLLDCHPLIREHFAKQLSGQNDFGWRSAHYRLCEHLKNGTEEFPDTIESLQPLYQAITHACKAGMKREACQDIYSRRIKRGSEHYSTYKLGALDCDLSAVACFFEQAWNRPASSFSADTKAYLLNQAAYYLRGLGRLAEALEPSRAALAIRISQMNWESAATNASCLSEIELTLGDVPGAVRDGARSVEFADLSGDTLLQRWARRARLATAMHQAGKNSESLHQFNEAESILCQSRPEYPLLHSDAGFSYCTLLLSDAERAAWRWCVQPFPNKSEAIAKCAELLSQCHEVARRASQTLVIAERELRPLDVALDHLTIGIAALYASVFGKPCIERAHRELTSAVNGLHRAGMMDHLPRSLLARAWLRCVDLDEVGARTDLDDAWDIAQRGPMRLHLADIHLLRGRLFSNVTPYPWNKTTHGQSRGPEDDLAAARDLIEHCGYWRRKEELEVAEESSRGKG